MESNNENTAVAATRSTLELAIEKGLDPVTIGKLMDLQERWEAGKARKAYVEAMAGFKRECPTVIGKDKKADFGTGKAKYSYATTAAIVTAITPALSKHGLHLAWESSQKDRTCTVTCHITHEGGHRESATLTGPLDESGGKNPIQMLGSSVHYLQRYTLVSVLGLATADMDDIDDNGGPEPIKPPQAKAAAQPTEGQVTVDVTIDSVSVKDSPAGAAKAWKKYGVKVGEVWYSTFDAKAGAVAESLKGKAARIVYTTDAKGYHNIMSIEAVRAEQAAPGAILAEAVSLVEKSKPTKVTAAMKAAGITEYEEGGDWQSVSIEKLAALISELKK